MFGARDIPKLRLVDDVGVQSAGVLFIFWRQRHAGENDDRQTFIGRCGAQEVEQREPRPLHALFIWESNIERHGVDVFATQNLQGLIDTRRLKRCELVERQERRECGLKGWFVLNDQHCSPSGHPV